METLVSLSPRTRMLLLNTFDMAEELITLDNVGGWLEKLNSTYPEQFAGMTGVLEECDLEAELGNVC